MHCRNCQSTNTKRYGFNRKGTQKHRCKDCNRVFVETPDPRRMTAADEARALHLYEEGLSMRAVARAMGRGATTLWTFFKKSGMPLESGSRKASPTCA